MKKSNPIKCVVIGDPAVGKTAITQVFVSEGSRFPKSYNLTLGVEINSKYIALEEGICELLIYDSSGHDIYNDILLKCWKDTKLMLVVYDLTSQQSLENVANWVQMVKQSIQAEIPAILFGNKLDLTTRRCISRERGEEVSQRLNMVAHIEGSAKEYEGIEEVFTILAKSLTSK